MEAKHTSRTMGQGQLYCSGRRRVHLIPRTSLNPDVRHHRLVAKALSESRNGEIKKKIKSGLESVYPGIKNDEYPLKVLVQFWALKAAPDGCRYLVTTSDRIFRLSKYDEGLFRYWAHCRSGDYFVDGGSEAVAMLAWTQEAWHRSTEDHPELNHALHFALPVVEPSSTSAQHSQSQTVVGLLEIVVIPNYNNSGYAEAKEEVTKIREALEVAKALSESRSREIKKKIKSGLESVYPGIKNYAYPLKVLVQFWAVKAAPDGCRYLVTTSDRIFRLSKYDEGLFRYWAHCRSRHYFVDGGPEAEDAFCQSELAWTQEAWHRSTKDHPELNHARHFALPVVEPSSTSAQHSQSQTVVGLLEIVVIPNYNNNSGYAKAKEEVTKIREALEIYGVGTLKNVLLVEARLRPGHSEAQVETSFPDENGRFQIVQIHTNKMKENSFLAPDVNLQELAARTKNYSGAELERVVNSAVLRALSRLISLDDLTRPVDEDSIKVTMKDFLNALQEIVPAFGASTDDLERCRLNGKVDCGGRHEHIFQSIMLLAKQVRVSNGWQPVTCLLEGPSGSGKTAMAASVGIDSDLPYVQIISAERMIGLSESSKCARIVKVFEDAYKLPLSIIILDDIERLLEYVAIGPRFSNVISQTLLVLLKQLPPKGKNVLVIGTTSEVAFLDSVGFRAAFPCRHHVPTLKTEDAKKVLHQLNVFSEDDIDAAAKALNDMPIKKLYMVVEMAAQGEQGGGAEAIYSGKEKIKISHFYKCLNCIV